MTVCLRLARISTQDREFVEQDLVEAQLNQQALADSQPQTLSLSKKLKLAAKGSTSTTSSCIRSCCRRRNPRSRNGSTGRRNESGTECELNDIESGGSSGSQPTSKQVKPPSPPQKQQQQAAKAHQHRPAPSTEGAMGAVDDQPGPSTSKMVKRSGQD